MPAGVLGAGAGDGGLVGGGTGGGEDGTGDGEVPGEDGPLLPARSASSGDRHCQ